ncbi:MAG TPA: hypothetical protein VMY37_35555 [Thermoguttaceae bacterium]|nr:hypothetical protein [Thermoguttaceae bacterium]
MDERQRRIISAGLLPPRCGELAVQLGILKQRVVDRILQLESQYRAEGKHPADPLAAAPRFDQRIPLARRRAVAGVVVLIVLGATWYWFRDGSAVFGVASVMGTLWVALEAVFPAGFKGPIALHRGIRVLTVVLAGICLIYCGYVTYQTYILIDSVPADQPISKLDGVASLWRRFAASALILGGCGMCFFALALVRRVEIWVHENRNDLVQELVRKACAGLQETPALPKPEREEARFKLAEDVLRTAAYAVSLNPWDRVLSWLLPWKRPIGAPSLWYLEPCTDPQKGFDIRMTVVPGASLEAWHAFEMIQKNHHPVALDKDAFRKAMQDCTSQGELDEVAFRRLRDDQQFVSLSGFVFGYCHGIPYGDFDGCLAVDRTYMGALEDAPLPKVVARWLNFASFAAYPVVAGSDGDGKPIGVVIAFKNVPNGITPEDQSVLVTCAQLLGLLLTKATEERIPCVEQTTTALPSCAT